MWSRSGSTSSERSTRSSAVPTSWRARTGAGSRAITRNTIQARSDDNTAAPSTPSFASSSCCPSKARLEIRSETVNPMPATAPPPAISGQLSARRSPPSRDAEPGRAEDPERLAHHVAEQDSQRHGGRDSVAEQLPVQVDARVREREQRHDHEAGPGVEPVLKPLVRGDRGRNAQLRRACELGRGLLAEGARRLRHTLEVGARRRDTRS